MVNKKAFFQTVGITMLNHPEYRRGQTMFNVFSKFDPDKADEIRSTSADPFHNDANIEEFLTVTGLL